jgi:hypothetical protein
LSAIRNRRKRRVSRTARAIAFAALYATLLIALHLGSSVAQTSDDGADERSTESTEETAIDSTEVDPATAQPTPTKSTPTKRSKKFSKPFEPSEKIEAESVISFPANI